MRSRKTLYPAAKGIVAFVPPLLILLLLYLLSLRESPGFSMIAAGIVLIPGIVAGSWLGYIAGRIRTRRRLKLVTGVLVVYWLCAVAVAGAIMSASDNMSVWEKITGAMWLGSAGALIFGVFVIPVIIAAALLLELWTRENREEMPDKTGGLTGND